MAKRKRLTLGKAVEEISAAIEKGLAKYPAKDRAARLAKIHDVASNAGQSPRERRSGHSETRLTPLLARPREES